MTKQNKLTGSTNLSLVESWQWSQQETHLGIAPYFSSSQHELCVQQSQTTPHATFKLASDCNFREQTAAGTAPVKPVNDKSSISERNNYSEWATTIDSKRYTWAIDLPSCDNLPNSEGIPPVREAHAPRVSSLRFDRFPISLGICREYSPFAKSNLSEKRREIFHSTQRRNMLQSLRKNIPKFIKFPSSDGIVPVISVPRIRKFAV